jgi:NDP-sugar pyrophosphorylase family protein
MKAMILAAGEGIRARPLTDFYAKPALPIPGGTIFTHLLQQLKTNGITEIALNLHYLPATIMDAIERYPVWNVRINPFDEPVLAGSGGGFYRIREFFGEEAFLIVNGDTITDVDFRAMIDFHNRNGNMVTFLAKPDHSDSKRVIDTDKSGKITAIRRQPERGLNGFSWKFCGAMVIDKEIFRFFPEKDVIDFFDDVLIPLLIQDRFSGDVYSPRFNWLEFGTPGGYYKNCRNYLQNFFPHIEAFSEFVNVKGSIIHSEAEVTEGTVKLNSYIGKGCRIIDGAEINDTIVYNAVVSKNVILDNSIILADFIPESFSCRDCILLPDLRIVDIRE